MNPVGRFAALSTVRGPHESKVLDTSALYGAWFRLSVWRRGGEGLGHWGGAWGRAAAPSGLEERAEVTLT